MAKISHNVSDLTGQRFAALVVTGRGPNTQRGRTTWRCLCDCGAETLVVGTNLKTGNTESCGCRRVQALAETTNSREKNRVFLQFTPDYIFDRSIPEPNSGCWLWLGPQGSYGYGQVRLGKVATSAQRASYIAHVGPVADGLEIDHLCRNPICVNPEHLEAVTHAENCRRRDAARALIPAAVGSSGGQS